MAEQSAKPVSAYKILVLANAAPGCEAEFNRWYNEQHIPDILATPGFVSARRFGMADAQVSAEPGPHRFVALYEVETDDLPAVLEALAVRRAAGEIVGSDAIAPGPIVYVLEPITEVIRAAAVGDSND